MLRCLLTTLGEISAGIVFCFVFFSGSMCQYSTGIHSGVSGFSFDFSGWKWFSTSIYWNTGGRIRQYSVGKRQVECQWCFTGIPWKTSPAFRWPPEALNSSGVSHNNIDTIIYIWYSTQSSLYPNSLAGLGNTVAGIRSGQDLEKTGGWSANVECPSGGGKLYKKEKTSKYYLWIFPLVLYYLWIFPLVFQWNAIGIQLASRGQWNAGEFFHWYFSLQKKKKIIIIMFSHFLGTEIQHSDDFSPFYYESTSI